MDPMVCTTRDGVRNVFRDVQVMKKSSLFSCTPLCKSNPIFCPTSFSKVITSIEEDQVLVLVRQFTTDLKTILVYDRVREAIQYFCANNSIDEVR